METNNQLTFDDIIAQENIGEYQGRIAYIDEWGSYGFDFQSLGNSKYYILCAIVIEEDYKRTLHEEFLKIKKQNGLANAELKSSKISEKRRNRIITQLLPLHFRIVLFIADKQKFVEGSPLVEYKRTFVKFLDQHFYNMLYNTYPKLSIIQDEIGKPEFMKSFKDYVEAHRPEYNFFNQYDFDFVNSKEEDLVQIADLICGSIAKSLLDPDYTDYLEILRGKISYTERFPSEHEPYWGKTKPEDYKYNKTIFGLSVKSARRFIEKYSEDETFDRKMQVAVIKLLLMHVLQIDPTVYVFADELVANIKERFSIKVTRNMLYRRVIAPLRDEGVILASCNKGYKIPVSVEDLMRYMNQSLLTVGPMVHRMGICRATIKQGTDNELDLFDDPALIRFKRYFDER